MPNVGVFSSYITRGVKRRQRAGGLWREYCLSRQNTGLSYGANRPIRANNMVELWRE